MSILSRKRAALFALTAGIALAFVLLGPRSQRPGLELATTAGANQHATVPANHDMEQEAA